MSALPEVSTANFDAEVVKANMPVLVDFWAPWCGPCRMVAPIVEAAAEEFKGKMKFVKLNTDQSPDLAGKFQIMGIPCLIFFSAGKEVDRVVGFLTKEALAQKINSVLVKK